MAEEAGVQSSKQKSAPRTAKAPFSDLVVVCAKCAKRQGIGKREVGRGLKRAFKRAAPARKVKVVVTGCLGPCPKHLIAAATPASLAARRLLLLDPDLNLETLAALLPDFGRKA